MQRSFSTRKLALAGMMAAVVFAGNYARIVIPISLGGQTAFTLGNIFSCLSGLLLGPVGGLASGVGAALYDLMDPRYAADCWITFLTKGAMGLAAGLAVSKALKRDELTYARALAGTVAGCITYYLLYFAKTFFYSGLLLKGLTPALAGALVLEKIPASLFNAAIAIIAAPPLAIAILAALKRSGIKRFAD
jgi:uncharacterized membrane protein